MLQSNQKIIRHKVGLLNLAEELRKLGVFVSASGVRSVWPRHELANFKALLKALEAKVANDGIMLTEAQVQALEKKKLDDEAWSEIDTAHPGYLGFQDSFYVATLKGVGRVSTSIPTPRPARPSCAPPKPRSPPPTC